ncbi:MAG: B12-binding domain-containing radical SAM protein [Acidobacteriia bacterium]|nr:B12-binding domain-containing radical SAM protein [Terriglobia bacterium]
MAKMTGSSQAMGAGDGGRARIRVCLISLYSCSAIGLRYLASVLRENGIDVHLIFFKDKDIALDLMERPSQREYELLLQLIGRLDPHLVGLGVRSSFLSIAREITRQIQTRLNKPVIWGGTHATVAPDESIQIADMICLGEGEQAILELAQELALRNVNPNVESIWTRRDGSIVRNPIRGLWQNLDALPFPDYIDESKYFVHHNEIACEDPGRRSFNLDVITSRGCPYRCSYCSNSILSDLCAGKGRAIRRRSVKNVLDELRSQRDNFADLKRIDFIDEVFTWDRDWAEEFVEQYKRDIGLPFHCMQHPETVDREILCMLRDAGLERVEIGIQSGSARVRKEVFNRPVSDEKLINTSRIMRELRIVPFYDVIVDNPFETTEDKRSGLKLLLSMSRPFHMHMFSLIYFPNTILTRNALEAKVITEDQVEGRATTCFDQWYVSLNHPRPLSDRYWLSLYSLCSKNFVPKRFIRFLSGVNYLSKAPFMLVRFAILCNFIKLGSIAVKWLFEGKPVLSSIGKRRKSGKAGSRIV